MPTINSHCQLVSLRLVISLSTLLVWTLLASKAINTKPEDHLAFGKTGGQWTINGVGWSDVEHRVQITVRPKELSPWRITTGGGWHHPVHKARSEAAR
jgi:hypothetical protein